jgi:hypothetical protein
MNALLGAAPKRFVRLVGHPLWLPLFVLLGVLIRLAFVAKLGGNMMFADERDYDSIGQAIANGQGFVLNGVPTAFRPPGEPLVLSVVYAFVGHRVVVVEVLQALLLGVVPLAIARMARRHGLDVFWSNLAGATASLHPALAYASATLYPTSLTATALALGVMWSADAIETGCRRQGVLAGLCLGVTGTLTTTFVPTAGLVAIAAVARRKWGIAVLIASVAFAPAVAWMARNESVLGAPVLTTNASGNLAIGANDQATPRSGNWVDGPALPPGVGESEVARDHAYRAVALGWIRAHRLRYAALVVGRAIATLDSVGLPTTRGIHDSAVAHVVGYAMLPWVVLGVVGIGIDWRKSTAQVAAAALMCVVVASAFTIVKPRFRFPCDPILAVFSVAVVARAWTRSARARGDERCITHSRG